MDSSRPTAIHTTANSPASMRFPGASCTSRGTTQTREHARQGGYANSVA